MKPKISGLFSVLLSLAIVAGVFNLSCGSAAAETADTQIRWDFEDGNVSSWAADAPANLTFSAEKVGTGNTALRLNHTYNDKTALSWWDNAGIKITQKMDLTGYKAVVFDIILDPSAIDGYGRILPAACIQTEGWAKFIQCQAEEIAKLPEGDPDAGKLVKVKCVAPLPENTGVIEQLVIWVTGGAINYSKPIYVDNIGFTKTVETAPETEKILTAENSPVKKYGQLSVSGTHLCAQDGTPVQLTGMSFPMLLRNPDFVTRNVFQSLAYDWKCDVVRLAVDIGKDDYTGAEEQKRLIRKAIDLAIENGMYVILDWHVLTPGDPLDSAYSGAGEFFNQFSAEYKDCPNIIYELCNEPNGNITWKNNIKPYAENMIDIIRKNDPDSVIIVGTGTWSQDVRDPADDPINAENLMYTVHFYSGSHTQSLRDSVSYALSKNIAIFATEWGMTSHTGADGIFIEETEKWLKLLEDNKISWTNWAIGNAAAESSILKTLITAGEEDGLIVKAQTAPSPQTFDNQPYPSWTENELDFSGKYMRNLIRGYHDYEIIFKSDELKIDSVDVTENGGKYTVNVKASGGKNSYRYSCYLIKDGKVHSHIAYLNSNQFELNPTESGTYKVRVYVDDALNKRCVKQTEFTVK